jgi:UDP-2,3-diacylglucosamine pyrophosphatase LpxH
MYLVISDTHIGDKQANKNLPSLFNLLERFSQKECVLVLNGDIFDFSKFLGFDERHRTFLSIIKKFRKIIYIEGNHDWFVSGIRDSLPHISFRKELILKIDNKIIKIAHGHQTETFIMKHPMFARTLTRINKWFYELSGIDLQHILRKTWLVQKFLLQRQEKKLVRMERQANIIIAGHTHRPCVRKIYDTMYYNTGDWVETPHRAYVLINNDGSIELRKENG